MNDRPPVGFIVEGHGEYNCYRSLFCKINSCHGFDIPIVNAGGCGSVIKGLAQQLDDLLIACNPINIIITVDLKDAVSQNLAKDVDDLLSKLYREVDKWRAKVNDDERFHPLPDKIICIAQVIKFETWVISDLAGLKRAGIVKKEAEVVSNVELISEPTTWLKKNLVTLNDIKNPKFAKLLVSALNPHEMRLHSQSFDKFCLECESIYRNWIEQWS